jgi:predicted amino acid dehydrogenase
MAGAAQRAVLAFVQVATCSRCLGGQPGKTKVAVIGAFGYVGEELVRPVLRHPYAEPP